MEKRCEEVETNIALNIKTIDKQTEEIVRFIIVWLIHANFWNQERLRHMLNDSCGPPESVGEVGDSWVGGNEGGLVPSFMLATTAGVALLVATFVVFFSDSIGRM